MNENPRKLNEAELIEAYKSGKLLDWIFDRFSFAEEAELNSILGMCIALHNAGDINLLSLINIRNLESIEGFRFFDGQHFYCKAIPQLEASTDEMMHCVHALVEKGGQDLAADQPNGAFREWCEADLRRAREVVDAAKNDDPMAAEFLTFALTAGNMVEEARGFVEDYTDKRRISGVSALGRMQ